MSAEQRRAVEAVLLGSLVSVVLLCVGCIDDRPVNRQEGDACRTTGECGAGLECVGLECVPAPPGRRGEDVLDVGFGRPERDAGGFEQPDLPPPRDVAPPPVDTAPPPDAVEPPPDVPGEMICTPGERECASNEVIRVCRRDGLAFDQERCADGTICQMGVCAAREDCRDGDGDGFPAGPGCVGAVDCNDGNARINPRAQEICNGLDDNCNGRLDEGVERTWYRDDDGDGFGADQVRRACARPPGFAERDGDCDDRAARVNPAAREDCGDNLDNNCDGRINEGCEECCDPGDCGDEAICVECSCQEAPEDECLFQNQPCDPFQAGSNGTYQCIDFSGGADGICYGACALNARDPDSTCPEPGSICAFEFDFGEGVCLLRCDPLTQTGCFEGQGCIAIRDTGGCVPVGEGELGEPCDPEEGIFDVCQAGLICTEIDQFGTTCERLCHPFATVDNLPPLCTDGRACFSFDTDFGLCFESLDQPEGSECDRRDGGRMCSDDVMCSPAGRGRFACQRLCRFERGDGDCENGGECETNRFLDSDEIGLCR